MRLSRFLPLCVALAFASATPASAADTVKIGSKAFTESVILGDVAALLVRDAGATAHHVRELGGTRVVWNALVAGEIDLYPDYTGTLTEEIFAGQGIGTTEQLEAALAAKGLGLIGPLGFNNTYALGMTKARAAALGIASISDLSRAPQLVFGFSNEFMDRAEGWPGVRARYSLPQTDVKGMSHDLAYRGLESGAIAVTDLYSTDAEITKYGLVALADDLHYFPRYDAVLVYRKALAESHPEVIRSLGRLAGAIDETAMIAMNARARVDGVPEAQVASEFVNRRFGLATSAAARSIPALLRQYTLEHLQLVLLSLVAAIVVSIPLGVAAAKLPSLGRLILALAGIVQTIPSLALLVFMIPVLGIGSAPAIVALFLYSLLPIVRNTHQGLVGIPSTLRDSAIVLGLPAWTRLTRIELPLAAGPILAGIKTAAVINIGTATLGALVGAGGYGQPILTGIRLDDVGLIMLGAVPAAVLAILTEGLFGAAAHLWLRPQT